MVGENSSSRFLKEKRQSTKSDVSKVLYPDIGKITNHPSTAGNMAETRLRYGGQS